MPHRHRQADIAVGSGVALVAVAVLWSARAFPVVPGQKLGAGFLPMLIGAGLLVCGIVLVWRSLRPAAGTQAAAPAMDENAGADESYGSAFVIIAVIVAYVLLVDWLGFLLVAPVALGVLFRALRVNWVPTVAWAIGGTLVVHFAFYKLLRVPLPWGVLRPFY